MRSVVWTLIACLSFGCASLNGPSASNEKAHVVAKGQTLSEISGQYGVSMKKIMKANPKIDNPNQIREGDSLMIPAALDDSEY